MKRKEAEKLAIELGRFNFERGDDGFGGENVPHESAVKLLMGYVFAPPNCPACEKQTTSQYACTNNSCTQSNSDREAPAQPPCSECATLRKERDDAGKDGGALVSILWRLADAVGFQANENGTWKWSDAEAAIVKSREAAEAQLSTLRDALKSTRSRLLEVAGHTNGMIVRLERELKEIVAPTPEVARFKTSYSEALQKAETYWPIWAKQNNFEPVEGWLVSPEKAREFAASFLASTPEVAPVKILRGQRKVSLEIEHESETGMHSIGEVAPKEYLFKSETKKRGHEC